MKEQIEELLKPYYEKEKELNEYKESLNNENKIKKEIDEKLQSLEEKHKKTINFLNLSLQHLKSNKEREINIYIQNNSAQLESDIRAKLEQEYEAQEEKILADIENENNSFFKSKEELTSIEPDIQVNNYTRVYEKELEDAKLEISIKLKQLKEEVLKKEKELKDKKIYNEYEIDKYLKSHPDIARDLSEHPENYAKYDYYRLLIKEKNEIEKDLTDIDKIKEKMGIVDHYKLISLNPQEQKYYDERNKKEETIIEPEVTTSDNVEENEEQELEEEIQPIEDIKYKPKLTWKTVAMIAAGIGVGATVFFVAGPVGITVMDIGLGIGKAVIKKQRKKLEEARLNGETKVENVEEPDSKIKKAMFKLKEYLKSEEGLRDLSWGMTSAIITGSALSIAQTVSKLIPKQAPTHISKPTVPTHNNHVFDTNLTNTAKVTKSPLDGIKLGDSVGSYNVSTGYDSANFAVNNINKETLISKYVNGESVFKRFAVVNKDGSIGKIINTKGLSLTEFLSKNGLSPSDIAVDIGSKDGISQAWTTVADLLKEIPGKVR